MMWDPNGTRGDEVGRTLEEIDRALAPYMGRKEPYLKKLERVDAAHGLARGRTRDPSVNDDMMLDKQARPRDIDKVAAGCPFIAETLAKGGANLTGEIQWHDMMALACHCAEPETTAHRLCSGSPYYDPDDTAMKLAEAQRARETDPALGFTRCATLERNGAQAHCATCKYQKYGKSPLNTPEANEIEDAPARGKQAREDVNYGLIPEAVGEDGEYQPIPGAYYEASEENIERLNRRICRVVMGSDTLFYENLGRKGHQWRKPQGIEMAWAGTFVRITQESRKGAITTKLVPTYKWYLDHSGKLPPALPVFKPREQPGHIGNDEYNMWSGWSVQPDPNYDIKNVNSDVRIITDHIRDVLCRGDRDRFTYVMGWLAWKVQHPEQPSEAVLVFRSRPEGTGKNIIMDMHARLFGVHGIVFGDKRSVTGEHATNEYMLVGIIDEALFHGDRQTTDMLKSMITGDKRVINPKFQDQRSITNMGSYIIFSNHDIVVTLGSHARRHVVFDVDESKRGDFAYFERLKAATIRGAGQFLHFLMNVPLGNWHPRRIIHTIETSRHQIAGMGATLKWLLDCSEEGKVVGEITLESKFYTYIVSDGSGGWKHQTGVIVPLDGYVPTDMMFAMFLGWAKSTHTRDIDATNKVEFGRKMTEVLGPHTRLRLAKSSFSGAPQPGQGINDRPWVYKIPDEDELRERVYKAWGVKS